MPVGTLKNTIYGLAMPFVGKRCEWTEVNGGQAETNAALRHIFKKRHAVGICVQCFRAGKLTEHYSAGFASLEQPRDIVTEDTIFRTASLAKMITALLVFRLQTLGKIDICEDISTYLGYEVRNPHCPKAPITLGMLLGHTSTIIDSPAYFASFDNPRDLRDLLQNPDTYQNAIPGMQFRYSNFAAGLIACLLENHFSESFETLIRRELFVPLEVEATFDLSTLVGKSVANSYGILPSGIRFNAGKRRESAVSLAQPDPSRHYLLASGNLYVTAKALAQLGIVACNGADGFIDAKCLSQMKNPVSNWPEDAIHMRHGMGILQVQDSRISKETLWGHQGFAYGAVNGVFFDEDGNGFAMLNSGASEQRNGHLALLNRDLIAYLINNEK